jgi:hypothetical protein
MIMNTRTFGALDVSSHGTVLEIAKEGIGKTDIVLLVLFSIQLAVRPYAMCV